MQAEADDEEQDDADQRNGHVLAPQVGAGAFLDGGGDLLHFFVAGRLRDDPSRHDQSVNNGNGSTRQRQLQTVVLKHWYLPGVNKKRRFYAAIARVSQS